MTHKFYSLTIVIATWFVIAQNWKQLNLLQKKKISKELNSAVATPYNVSNNMEWTTDTDSSLEESLKIMLSKKKKMLISKGFTLYYSLSKILLNDNIKISGCQWLRMVT